MSSGWSKKSTVFTAADKRRFAETKKPYKQRSINPAGSNGNKINNKTKGEKE